MKVKALMIVFLSSFIVITGATQMSAQSQSDEHLKKMYETRIAKKIAKCQSKIILKSSRSENLQETAETAAEQAHFLTLNKDTLVGEMMERNIGPKPYKIEFYLNSRFYEIYK